MSVGINMIKTDIQRIKPLTRLSDNSERFQVELGDSKEARECISKLSLLEPGVECVVVILSAEEWEIMKEAFKAL